MNRLNQLISALADRPYHQVQALQGAYDYPGFKLRLIRMQRSPGAHPASIASVTVLRRDSVIPAGYLQAGDGKLAVADFLIRRFRQNIDRFALQNRGKEGSGSFATIELSQKMLARDSVLIDQAAIELRFMISLPAKGQGGGVIDAEQARIMLDRELPAIVDATFFYARYDQPARILLGRFVDVATMRTVISRFMRAHRLVAFIADGARLPRRSGIDDRPAADETVIAFQAPDVLRVEIPLPDGRQLSGMGIREGVTCITGGGYHGKSTLMQALLAGVYAHVPDDGREWVVTREDAFFIRAEDGRSVRNVDISPFIGDLPSGLKTDHFSSDNASGSTSQAAAIVEAVESGSRLLLFDEDTCATNFLVRDALIEQVLDPSLEPIRPLYATVRTLWKKQRVSMIFVIGGLGHFLLKADTCLLMAHYRCHDITANVRARLGAIVDDDAPVEGVLPARRLAAGNFDPAYENKRLKKTLAKRIKPLRHAPRQLEYGMDLVNLEAVAQIAEAPQVLALGYCLLALRHKIAQSADRPETIRFWIDRLYDDIAEHGLSVLAPDYPGTLSMPRKYELAAAINRIRSLRIVEPCDDRT
jgi:predicted ABC-class ATPase